MTTMMLNRTQQTDFDFVFVSILTSIRMGFLFNFCFFARSLRSKAIFARAFEPSGRRRRGRRGAAGFGGGEQQNSSVGAEGRWVFVCVFVYWHLILVTPDGPRFRSTFLPRLPLAMVVLF